MKKFLKISVLLLSVIIAVAGAFPAAAVTAQAEKCAEEIIALNLEKSGVSSVQGWIDGAMSDSPAQGAEWYALALSRYGDYDWKSYEAALLDWLGQNEVASASSRLKYALVLAAIGSNDSFITEALENSAGKQGIMSLVFALHLMNNGFQCSAYTAESLKNELLALQQADSGWSLTGNAADADVTAMVIQSLAPFYGKDGAVNASVDAALGLLSDLQGADGGYSNYGVSNPESAAQILLALSSIGIDASNDSRFIKNGKTVFDAIDSYRLDDGSYCHKAGENSNATATVQVFYSMVGYIISVKGQKLYVFDAKEMPKPTDAPTLPQTQAYSETTPPTSDYAETESCTVTVHHPSETVSGTESQTPAAVILPTEETTQIAQTEAEPQAKKPSISYKVWAAAAVIAFTVAVCCILIIKKKCNIKNILLVAAVACAALAFIVFSDIRTVDDFARKETKTASMGSVTMSISCEAVPDKSADYIPDDGVILAETVFEIGQGDTVYDVLLEAAGRYNIRTETQGAGDSVYVEGIGHIYELDFGDLSGWMYFVNGSSPDVGCGEYTLSDGDLIEWRYTCNLGADVENQ